MANQGNSWEPSSTLKSKFQENRKNKKGTDVTLVCGNQKYPAHKLILSTASPYFERMFQSSFIEARSEEVKMSFDPVTMNNVLNFIYLDKDANVQLDNLEQVRALLEASNMLQLADLFRFCCMKAKPITKPEDFWYVASLKKLYQNDCMKMFLGEFVTRHWLNVLNGDLYLKCSFEQFEMLIEERNKDLATRNQKRTTQAFHSVGFAAMRQTEETSNVSPISTELLVKKLIQWIKENPSERTEYASSLFSKINWRELSRSFVKTLLDEKIVHTNCSVLLQILRINYN